MTLRYAAWASELGTSRLRVGLSLPNLQKGLPNASYA